MGEVSRQRALVTGATGFIGGRLAARLLNEGWAVRALVRNEERLPADLRGKIEVIAGDLADLRALGQAVAGVDVIFHCAADVKTWDSFEAYYAANVQGVENLLNAIIQRNPRLSRLVHVSTVDVFGFPQEAGDEHCSPVESGFGYGDTKLLGEAMVHERCGKTGIPYTIIRPGNVIGPGSQFISRIGSELSSGLMLTVDGGRANAGLVYVDNLIDYMLWAARSEAALAQCYTARDNYDVTWSTFIWKFRSAINGKGLVLNLPFWAADGLARMFAVIWRIVMPSREPLLHPLLVRIFGRTCGHSAEKIRRDSGLASRIGFEEAMARSARWYLEELHRK